MRWSPRLGAHLEAARVQAGLRRLDLAQRLGVSEESIRLWERGAVQPSEEHLVRLIPLLSIEAAAWHAARSGDETEPLPALARRLRDERDELGLTQAAVAGRLGVAQATYAGWETGRTTPGPTHTAAVAEHLGMDQGAVEELIGAPFVVDAEGWSELGRILGERRQALRLTRSALAGELGVTARTVMAWELGYRRPAATQIVALAGALAVDPERLVAALPRRSAPSRLGELILTRSRELGLRARDVAQLVGTTEPTLSRWVNGHSRPGPQNLQRLADVLRIPHARLAEASRPT